MNAAPHSLLEPPGPRAGSSASLNPQGKLFLPSQLIWIVVGDISKVEAGIRELNVGEVHRIDADGNPVR